MSVMHKIAKSTAAAALTAIPAALVSKRKSRDILTVAATLIGAVVAIALVKED